MPFTAITDEEVGTGQSVQSTTGTKIKNNFDDHEARLADLEGGASTTYPPAIFSMGGHYDIGGARDNVLKSVTNFPVTILGVRLYINTAGSTGTTEVDVKFKRGSGSYTSILLTKPSVASSAGDDAISTNGVVNPTYQTLEAGDIIRIDLSSVQSYGIGCYIRIDYTRG